jgi:hypothetical protein
MLILIRIATGEEDFHQSYDTLLRSLVIENEKRLRTKAHEAALKVHVGEWAKPNYNPTDIESRQWARNDDVGAFFILRDYPSHPLEPPGELLAHVDRN